jgi:hypothetical protein
LLAVDSEDTAPDMHCIESCTYKTEQRTSRHINEQQNKLETQKYQNDAIFDTK